MSSMDSTVAEDKNQDVQEQEKRRTSVLSEDRAKEDMSRKKPARKKGMQKATSPLRMILKANQKCY